MSIQRTYLKLHGYLKRAELLRYRVSGSVMYMSTMEGADSVYTFRDRGKFERVGICQIVCEISKTLGERWS